MARYRKKPVVVDAIQWRGDNLDEVREFLGFNPITGPTGALMLYTLEGVITASPNDWIIKGVQDEFYPCKPDIFEQTYEAVEDGTENH